VRRNIIADTKVMPPAISRPCVASCRTSRDKLIATAVEDTTPPAAAAKVTPFCSP
jgi:hypothetical protein